MLDSINALENEIIQADLGDNDMFSLSMISLLKNSYNYHYSFLTTEGKIIKKDKLQFTEREGWKIIASTTADYCVGAGYFLSTTAATGGSGALVALGTASTVGGGASAAVELIGGALGAWDLSPGELLDAINPFS